MLTVSDGPVLPVAPSIVTQPVAVVVNAGNTATFAVGVSGSGPLAYQWLRNGTPIAGATAAFYTIAQAARGRCRRPTAVRVSNGAGRVDQRAATLTVNAGAAGSAPAISTQPATLVVAPGGSATLAVAASGSGPLALPVAARWRGGGGPDRRGLPLHVGVGARRRRLPGAGEQRAGRGDERHGAAARGRRAGRDHPAGQRQRDGGQHATFSVAASGDRAALPMDARQVAIAGATGTSYTTPAPRWPTTARSSASSSTTAPASLFSSRPC